MMPRRGEWGTRAQEKRRHAFLREHPYCRACGTGVRLTIDHIIPRAIGGSMDDPANWQVLCSPCNSVKGTSSMTPDQIRARRFGGPPATPSVPTGPRGSLVVDYTRRKRSDP